VRRYSVARKGAVMNILMQAVVTKEIPGIPGTDVAGAAYEKCLNKISRVAHKDTKITISYPERSSYLLHSSYGEFLNNSGVIEGAIRGEKEGCDAVIICCYTDCGLQPLREVLEIPVVGLAESSMAIACMLGRKFAIIAPVKEYIPVYEQNLRIYGFESRAIRQKPVRPLSLPSTANRFEQYLRYFEDPHSELIPHFESVAKSCVDDGAEVVIAGCGAVGPALAMADYTTVVDTGCPVIDPVSVTIKVAELLVDLQSKIGLSKSKVLTYRPWSEFMMQAIRKNFGLE
jgi:allantoin racemase